MVGVLVTRGLAPFLLRSAIGRPNHNISLGPRNGASCPLRSFTSAESFDPISAGLTFATPAWVGAFGLALR